MKRIIINLFGVALFISSCTGINSAEHEIKLIPISVNSKTGFINLKGEYVINPQFERASFFNEGLAKIWVEGGQSGYIDETGKIIINPQYRDCSLFSDGLACAVNENEKCKYIDKSGKVVFVADSAESCGIFEEGFAPFSKYVVDEKGISNLKFGFYDKTGKIIIQPIYERVYHFSEGLALVIESDIISYINPEGKKVINNSRFTQGRDFSEGLAAIYFKDKSQWGYIDKEGKTIIEPQFSYAGNFKNGLANVGGRGETGFIDKNGKYVINPQFEAASDFSSNQTALVWIKKENEILAGYIDKEGKYLINPQFKYAQSFIGDVAIVGDDGGKVGLIGIDGKYIANPQFFFGHNDEMARGALQGWFERAENDFINSDYFDKESIINQFVEGTTNMSFKNISRTTTAGQINNMYSDKNKSPDYYNMTVYPDMRFGNLAYCTSIFFNFTSPVSEDIPIYRTQQSYNAYKGGYVNESVFDHYEKVYNDNATLNYFTFKIWLTGKASGKENELMKSLAESIKNKMGGNFSPTDSNSFTITNNKMIVSIYVDQYSQDASRNTIIVTAQFQNL